MQDTPQADRPALLGPQTPHEGPVMLAPPPPADASLAQDTKVVQPTTASGVEHAGRGSPDIGAMLPWAAASVLAGCALIAWAMVSRRRAAVQPAESPHHAREYAQDIEEIGERVTEQLHEQTRRLEELIARAEARVVELKGLTQRPDTREFARSVAAPAPMQGEPKPLAQPAADTSVDPAIAMLYSLADQGLTPMEISKRTGRPTGQVELILNLRRHGAREQSSRV